MKKYIMLFSIGVFFFGCSKTISSEILNFNLKSYSSFSEIKKLIISKNGTYTIKKSRLSNLNNRPANEIIIMQTDLFEDNGFTGETYMTFWNNKLMEVTFFPNKHIEYMEYIKKEKNINSSNITQNGNLYIEIVKDYKGTYYVIFADIRLKEDMDDWIREYS